LSSVAPHSQQREVIAENGAAFARGEHLFEFEQPSFERRRFGAPGLGRPVWDARFEARSVGARGFGAFGWRARRWVRLARAAVGRAALGRSVGRARDLARRGGACGALRIYRGGGFAGRRALWLAVAGPFAGL
jgi:hypothetical protein